MWQGCKFDWEDLLKIGELTADSSTKMYLDKINKWLDTYVSLKMINTGWNLSLNLG